MKSREGIDKVVRLDAQDSLLKQVGRLVTVYEGRRHVKEAASRLFSRSDLEALAPDKDHFMAHIVAMGSSELYGANRNADEFPHAMLKKAHPTFVTHGHNYREHNNRDPRFAIGKIAAARYDDNVQRVELVLHTNIKKAAEEFERARSGEEMGGSMAVNVPCDTCTACQHVSKTASDRCHHIKYQAGRYIPSLGKYAHMRNDSGTFFDYSWVRRPADRIAWYLEYGFPKAASSDPVEPRSDELASAYGMNSGLRHGLLEALQKIAAMDMPEETAAQAAANHVWNRLFYGQMDQAGLDKCAAADPGKVMRAMVSRNVVMPFESFVSWVTGDSLSKVASDPDVRLAKQAMPGIRITIIRKSLMDPGFANSFGSLADEFSPACGCPDAGDPVEAFFEKAREQFACRYEDLAKRACHIEPAPDIRPVRAPESGRVFALGCAYNAYLAKFAALTDADWRVCGVLANSHKTP